MENKIFTMLRKISLIVGIAFVVGMGLLFILFTDLYLKADSTELFLAILFPLISVVAFVLSESFRHKPIVFIVLKCAGALFAVAFIIYIAYFMGTDLYLHTNTFLKLLREMEDGTKVTFLNGPKFQEGMDIAFDKTGLFVFMLVTSIVGAVGIAANTVSNLILGID